MKNMKSIVALTLATAVIMVGLTGCGNSKTSTSSEATSSSNSTAKGNYKWRMASTWNEGDPQGQGDAFFVKRVNELTNGQVEITVYPSMQLGDPVKAQDSVRQGVIEIAVIAPYTSTDERLAVTLLPFMAESFDEANKLFYTDGFWSDYVSDVLADNNMTRIANIDNDFRGINTVDKPITKVADMKGLLIRESGYAPYQDFYAACGASVTTIPYSELYTALEKKLCDAQDNGPINTNANKLYEAASNYTYLQQAYGVVFDVMNKDLYDSLPTDIQNAIMQAGKDTQDYLNGIIQGGYADNVLQTMRDAGVNVITKDDIDPKDYAEFRELGISVWKNYKDILGEDILNQLYAFKGITG